MAVDVLRSRGVPEERILFLNLIASPEGAENFAKKFPKLRVVTAFVDEGLDEKKYVVLCLEGEVVLIRDAAISFPDSVTLEIGSIQCKAYSNEMTKTTNSLLVHNYSWYPAPCAICMSLTSHPVP